MKKAFTILMTLILVVSMHLEIAAVDSMSHKLKIASMDDISDIRKCILTENIGFKEIKTIDTSTLNKISTLNASNEEKVKEIFYNLGITFTDKSNKQQYIVDNIDNIESITSNISYLKVASDGTQTLLDKNTCLAEVENAKQKEKLISESRNMSRNIIGDGLVDDSSYDYMRLVIAYFYLGNGQYEIVGEWEWLIDPICRFKDAFSLYAKGLTWANKQTNSYERITMYRAKVIVDGSVLSNQYITTPFDGDPSINQQGVFYTWDLPISTTTEYTVEYTDFICQLWGHADVTEYNNHYQKLEMYSRYVHKKLALNSNYDIIPELTGVDLDVIFNIGIQKAVYEHYFSWDYQDDARAAGEIR